MSDTTIHQVVAAIRDAHPAMCDSKGDIVLSCGVATDWAVIRDCEATITQTQIDRASLALRGITEQAKAWQWNDVEHKLDRAYAELGSENPGTGYDYHCGKHPVEIAATEFSLMA